MAEIGIQKASLDGLDPAYVSANAAGDMFTNNGATVLHVKNAAASPVVVTIASQVDEPPVGTVAADKTVSVPASDERFIGPFPRKAFDDEDGNVQISYDSVTSVTVAAISLA